MKSKKIILSIILTTILLFIPQIVKAATIDYKTTEEGIKYKIDEEKQIAIIVGVDNTICSENIIIPERIEGYPVTQMGNYAFQDNSKIVSIQMPNTITEMGYSLFKNCIKLENVTLSKYINSISFSTFEGCTSLKNIEIPSKVSFIGSSVFKNCTSLESIKLPSEITVIYKEEFLGCVNLKNVTLPKKLYSIQEYAFKDCINLSEIIIPESLQIIGIHAFSGCEKLTEICLPNGLTDIGRWAFYGCTGISEILIPEKVSKIGMEAFGCWNEGQIINIEVSQPLSGWEENWNLNTNATINYEMHRIKKITIQTTEIRYKEPAKLQIDIEPKDAYNQKLKYTINNEEIATIDENGIITPLQDGYVSIEVETTDGSNIFATKSVLISFYATELNIDKNNITFNNKEERETITATVLPDYTTCKTVEWGSTNESVAKVNNNGYITPIGNGECYITCRTIDGSRLYKECKVIVDFKATELTLDQTDITFIYEYGKKISATVGPEYTKNKKVEWTSSNKNIATVDENGLITPISNGKCEIICKTTDGSDIERKCNITVDFKATQISIDRSKIIFTEEKTEKINATVGPEYANNKKIKWISTAEWIATVDENGLVTPQKSNGTCRIIAMTTDGTDMQVECLVSVVYNIDNITLDKEQLVFTDYNPYTLRVIINPETAKPGTFEWRSNNEEVATVDENGKITPLENGYTTIDCIEKNTGYMRSCYVEVNIPEENQIFKLKESKLYETENNRVVIFITSNQKFANTKPTWYFGNERTYYKTYSKNGTYTTTFTNIYGTSIKYTFEINEIDETGPNIKINKVYDEEKGIMRVEAISNESLKETKPTWKLNEDQKTYVKTYNTNGVYSTTFEDIYGNQTEVTFEIKEIVRKYNVTKILNPDNTITVKVSSDFPMKETKPTWILSKDKKTYVKTYNSNGEYFTTFEDMYGNQTKVAFEIKEILHKYTITKILNPDNTVKVIVSLDIPMQKTKPTWILSADQKTYEKIYTENGIYSTKFTDSNGEVKELTFEINEIDKTGPDIQINIIRDEKNNTVRVEAISNEELKETKPTWKLSEDKKTYVKIYNANGIYSTTFEDIHGNKTKVTFEI